jgi:hypothetical protein
MPFTRKNLKQDLDDLGSNFDGSPGLEFRGATKALGLVELTEWDAVRVPPGSWRGYEAGPEGLELLIVGAPNLGQDPRGDVEGERDWWTD